MTAGKRAFDILFSLILLTPLSIVMLVVAGLLLLSQGRPVLYVAPRMKSADESFRLLKFRTMHRAENDSGATGAHKSWRITKLGRFLRRTRIDELPQLFNILRGDMSFVGPRPPLREYVERFPQEYGQVLKTRPGVTGLATLIYHAQEDRIMASCKTARTTEAVYYRRCLPTKLRLDMIYQNQRTMALDMWIIWNTLMTVMIPGWKAVRLAHRKGSRPEGRAAARVAPTRSGRAPATVAATLPTTLIDAHPASAHVATAEDAQIVSALNAAPKKGQKKPSHATEKHTISVRPALSGPAGQGGFAARPGVAVKSH